MTVAAVTGVTGLVGSTLTRDLLAAGCSVRGLVRTGADTSLIDGLDIERVAGDVRDPSAVRRLVAGADTVFHAAALISYLPSEHAEMHEINVSGTRHVVEACLGAGSVRLVHTSSIAALGTGAESTMVTEATPFAENGRGVGYRTTKYLAEREVLRGVEAGLDAVIVNPSVIMGPGDLRFRGGRMIRDIRKKRIFYAIAGGTNVVDVADVSRGHVLAARAGRRGERYILAGENHSFRHLFRVTAEVTGGIPPLFTIPGPMVRGVAAVSELVARASGSTPWVTRELVAGIGATRQFSTAKAERELGYTFRPFRKTVERTFAWYRQQGLL